MIQRKAVTEDVFDDIIAQRFAFGMDVQTIADKLGRSEKGVRQLCNTFAMVRDREFEKLATMLATDNSIGDKSIVWSAQRVRTELPSVVTDAMKLRRSKREGEKRGTAEQTAADEEIVEKNENDALYMIKLLEALHRQNELLEQLMDVVLPKYAADIKDNLNVNADVICERLKNSEQSLDKIAYNTRKRGV